MFGRKLKEEYKSNEYLMYNESNGKYAGIKYTNIEDPLLCMAGIIGIPFFATLFIIYSIMPRLGIIIPGSACYIIIRMVIVISAYIGYNSITEPDNTENKE